MPDKTTSYPWPVDIRYVFVTVSRSYNGGFMQDLNWAVSYLQRLGCAAVTLEPEQRAYEETLATQYVMVLYRSCLL